MVGHEVLGLIIMVRIHIALPIFMKAVFRDFSAA